MKSARPFLLFAILALVPRFRRWAVYALVLASVGCANIVVPGGGPKDTVGPVFIGVDPPQGTTRFTGRRITFTFDEFLQPGNLSRDLFLSPLPATPPRIYTQGRKLIVELREALPDSTTLSITLGSSIKDYNEKNILRTPITYAISSGISIDSGAITGRVVDAFTVQPLRNVKVLAYMPDSITGNNFYRRKPRYAAYSDSAGKFNLPFLRLGSYRLLAVEDADNTYSLSLPGERLGLPDSNRQVVRLTAAAPREQVQFRVFQPDTLAPRLLKAERWSTSEVHLQWDEPLLELYWAERLIWQSPPGQALRKQMTLLLPDSVNLAGSMLTAVDTAGNLVDTVLDLSKTAITQRPLRLRVDSNQLNRGWITLTLNRPLADSSRNALRVVDSLGRTVSSTVVPDDNDNLWRIYPTGASDTTMRYSLRVDSSLRSLSGARWDTLPHFQFKGLNPALRGSLSGSLGPEYGKGWQLLLLDEKGRTVEQAEGPIFLFSQLAAGKYRLAAYQDLNEDRRWTPGSLRNTQQPEPIVRFRETLILRPGWTLEDIRPTPADQR